MQQDLFKSEKYKLFNIEAAKNLPANIRFGTSTWTYRGWQGIIYYRDYKSEKDFKVNSLREYAECPLFRTVGIDSTFYKPPKESLLADYASMLPGGFKWCSKVWERITIPKYPNHQRYGEFAGTRNPDFLSADLFIKKVIAAYSSSKIRRFNGPFIFQFPSIAKSIMSAEAFFEQLESFLSKLPPEFKYAIEVRNPEFLRPDYFRVLNAHGATHCFNHWTRMPALREQMRAAADAGGLSAQFFVARLLTPLGVSYQQAVERFKPYSEIKAPNPAMRLDAASIVRRAITRNCEAFILVNNRSEGNAPMTINGIIELLFEKGRSEHTEKNGKPRHAAEAF
ncbi:MAG: DUF72 domain-containing protein [Candidatus Dadabacteria bacterium]|nr:MAG: DUF72 domain-containing protein [Candidatus Dadabacteria bacterium]